MKYMRILALAAPLGVLLALIAAGTSSATVLCSTTANPCPAGQKVPVGTFAKGSLKPGSSGVFTDTEGGMLATCSEAIISGTLEKAGSATETPSGKGGPENVTWGKCTFPMKTIHGGTVEVHHIAGTDNGTVTASGFETTLNTIFFGSCIYTYGSGTDIGIVTGGTNPSLDVNMVLNKASGSAFACPGTIRGSGEGIITEPTNTPIYVVDS